MKLKYHWCHLYTTAVRTVNASVNNNNDNIQTQLATASSASLFSPYFKHDVITAEQRSTAQNKTFSCTIDSQHTVDETTDGNINHEPLMMAETITSSSSWHNAVVERTV